MSDLVEPTLSFDAPSSSPGGAPGAPDSGGGDDNGDVSLFSLMNKAPEMPPDGQRGDEEQEPDDVELKAKEAEAEKAKEAEAAEKAAKEAEKPEEPKRTVGDERLIDHLEKHSQKLEARNDELLKGNAALEHRVQQYDVAVAMLQQEVELLYAALKERGVVDERDLRLREHDMEKAYQAKMAEAQKAYDERMRKAEGEISRRTLVEHYARSIPAAAAAFPLVDEAQIIAAIESMPPETRGKEDIMGIAKSLHERNAAAWRRYQNEQRKQRRDMPAPMSGKPPPQAIPLNSEGFQMLLERGRTGL